MYIGIPVLCYLSTSLVRLWQRASSLYLAAVMSQRAQCTGRFVTLCNKQPQTIDELTNHNLWLYDRFCRLLVHQMMTVWRKTPMPNPSHRTRGDITSARTAALVLRCCAALSCVYSTAQPHSLEISTDGSAKSQSTCVTFSCVALKRLSSAHSESASLAANLPWPQRYHDTTHNYRCFSTTSTPR